MSKNSKCSGLPKSECNPPLCHYVDGDKRKYCKPAYTRKTRAGSKRTRRQKSSSNTPPTSAKNTLSESESEAVGVRGFTGETKYEFRRSNKRPKNENLSDIKAEIARTPERISGETSVGELSPPKLVLPEPIPVPPHKKVKSEMDLFSEHSSKFEKYIGHIDIGNLYYIYLLNKYRSKCLIYDLTGADSSDYSTIGLTISTSLEQSVMDNLFIHMQTVAKLLSDCSETFDRMFLTRF